MTKSKSGRKGVFFVSITVPHHSPLSKRSQGRNSVKKPGGRSCSNGHGGVWLTGLLSTACSRETCPGVASPTAGWTLPHLPLVKKMPYRLAYRPSLGRHFLSERPSSLRDSVSNICSALGGAVLRHSGSGFWGWGIAQLLVLALISASWPAQ